MRLPSLLLVLALLLTACGAAQGPKARDAYTAAATLDAQNDRPQRTSDGAYLKRFPIQVRSQGSAPGTTPGRLAMDAREFDLKVAEQSHLNFLLQLDGKPVERYGTFKNVEVHAFAVSQDRQWLMHDHAHVEKQGMVDAHAHFPSAGQYVVFIQPTALDGKTELREMLRQTVTVSGN